MPISAPEPIVTLQKVSKFYGSFQALNQVSLEVALGERLVICGPSGSGKSTLIRCINQLERHDEGTITFAGVTLEAGRTSIKKIHDHTGMVFQQFNLFPHLSVLDNLMLGPVRSRGLPKAEAKALALHYLERVKIPEQASKLPRQLSGGQQQRVAIARALCMEPKIMLFDEPTSALDPEMINEVLEVMIELAESGMTMICVTHEMGFARQVADEIAFMDHGEIVEKSSPQQFFEAPASARGKEFLQNILEG